MNFKLLKALEKWQKKSKKRKVDIRLSSEQSNNKIWLYDDEYNFGKHIQKISQIPSNEFIRNQKKRELEEAIKQLEKLK